jgi:hypothetical protein
MSVTKKPYRMRLILGVICLIAGIVFMIHSFIELRLNPVIKPTNYESFADFGSASYKQLHAKLSEKAALVFAVSDFSTEKDFLLGFLKAGQEMDQREYILISNNAEWKDGLSQNFSFKGVAPTEDSLDSDSFVAPTYIVLVRQQDAIQQDTNLQLGPESAPEYQTYHFMNIAISKEQPHAYKCPNRKRAFELKSMEDLECFQVMMEKRVNRQRNLLDLTKQIGAIDQMDLKHYLLYFSK